MVVHYSYWYLQHQGLHSLVHMRPRQRMVELCLQTGVKLIKFLFQKIIISKRKSISPKYVDTFGGMKQSSQGRDPSPEPWLGDSRKIGPEMQEKALGFS